MPESLKTFANRCRCCLEKFYHDEEINTITNFFKIQFFSFTRLEVKTCCFFLEFKIIRIIVIDFSFKNLTCCRDTSVSFVIRNCFVSLDSKRI